MLFSGAPKLGYASLAQFQEHAINSATLENEARLFPVENPDLAKRVGSLAFNTMLKLNGGYAAREGIFVQVVHGSRSWDDMRLEGGKVLCGAKPLQAEAKLINLDTLEYLIGLGHDKYSKVSLPAGRNTKSYGLIKDFMESRSKFLGVDLEARI